jgi:hypothetical protein
MTEIARIFTLGISNRRELIYRLIECCESFKNMDFATAAQQYRYCEDNGLVRNSNGYLVIYHDFDN